MKKILVVLTILVLVAGFAFAGISGKVTAKYTVAFADFEGLGGISAAKNDINNDRAIYATFTLDSQSAGLTGANKPYVELTINASVDYIYEDGRDHYNGYTYTKGLQNFKLEIKTFKIVGEDWSVNLLKAEDAKLDLAKSAVDSVKFYEDTIEENTQYFSMKNAMAYTRGISVAYKGFVAGLGFNTFDLKDTYAGITLEVKTPEFTFDAVKVQAGAGFSQVGFAYDASGAKAYVASAKVAYEAETVDASVAADFSKSSKENEAKFDIAAHICVAPVTVDVYFANYAQVTNSKGAKDVVPAKNLLSAKAVVDVAKIAENLPVKLTITGKDLLNRYENELYHDAIVKEFGKIVDVEVNTTALANFDITATAGDVFNKPATFAELDVVYTGIENIKLEGDVKYVFAKKILSVDLSAEYTAEKYTAKAKVGVATDFEDTVFTFGASIESAKLVDGATLKAELSSLAFGFDIKDSKKISTLGSLSLSCTVEF